MNLFCQLIVHASLSVIVEEPEQRSTVHKSACMVKVEDPPILCILPKVEATDIPDKIVRAETIKEDASTVTCEVGQSNLLVNTLSRFAYVLDGISSSSCWVAGRHPFR